jgi:hypothetical protein
MRVQAVAPARHHTVPYPVPPCACRLWRLHGIGDRIAGYWKAFSTLQVRRRPCPLPEQCFLGVK